MESSKREENNEKRCLANELIRQLYEDGELEQLRILKMWCDQAVAILEKKEEKRAGKASI